MNSGNGSVGSCRRLKIGLISHLSVGSSNSPDKTVISCPKSNLIHTNAEVDQPG